MGWLIFLLIGLGAGVLSGLFGNPGELLAPRRREPELEPDVVLARARSRPAVV